MSPSPKERKPTMIGRYELHDQIASGGMATVHLGRTLGSAGWSRVVAIKCLREQYMEEADFVAMFIDEAKIVARINHPNVVPVLDVGRANGAIFLVMEFVQGAALSQVLKCVAASSVQSIPFPIVSAILCDMLHGLHAAHEAKDEEGNLLDIVHRDVSPQNVIVGADGVTRVLDFGIAKAAGRITSTRDGHIKGKLAYMAPEQLQSQPVSHLTDVYAAAAVLWEVLSGRRMVLGDSEGAIVEQILAGSMKPPSAYNKNVSDELDALVMMGLERRPHRRFASAQAMAVALEELITPARPSAVSAWLASVAGEELDKQKAKRAAIDKHASGYFRKEGAGVLTSDPPQFRTASEPLHASEETKLERRPLHADHTDPGPTGLPSANRGRLIMLGLGVLTALGIGVGVGNASRKSSLPVPAESVARASLGTVDAARSEPFPPPSERVVASAASSGAPMAPSAASSSGAKSGVPVAPPASPPRPLATQPGPARPPGTNSVPVKPSAYACPTDPTTGLILFGTGQNCK